MSVLSVTNLRAGYTSKGKNTLIVDGVSFNIGNKETVGLVGESGCGKSTLGKAVTRLIRPMDGRIDLLGDNIAGLSDAQLRPFRRLVQVVFQDPFASLNPRQTISTILETPLKVHGVRSRADRRRQVEALVERIGLPRSSLTRYPHEFSGGQRQRIGIARALVLQPRLLVCDEPVASLDLSIQAQIINLLVDLKDSLDLSVLFISHDLSVVQYLSDRVLVMYMGKIVESAGSEQMWKNPRHPYTKMLLAAVPKKDPTDRAAPAIKGEVGRVPLSQGCRFRDRCPMAQERCAVEEPALRSLSDGNAVACHFA